MYRLFILTFILAILSGCSDLTTHKLNSRDLTATSYDNHLQTIKNQKNQPAGKAIKSGSFFSNIDESNNINHHYSEIESDITYQTQSVQATLDQALDFCQASQDFWQQGEQENAIQALDQAYSLIINVDTPEDPKLLQQKEDIRFMISKRILEIYASRNTVVNGEYNAIPIVINKKVQEEINRFTSIEREFFNQALVRSGKYRPKILAMLKEAGLPAELSWLPLVESGFKIRALSKARALGLWQFIPSTGYKFGLKRDEFIDERLDPEKSTKAAIAYLTELHKIFGDWATVLAAYNCGEGRVLRIIRSQNVNYLDNFWDLYGRLPRETARYVPRFIATLQIINNPEKYGFDLSDLDTPDDYDTITVSKQIHLKSMAEKLDIPANVIYDLNPQLRYKISPNYPFEMKVPATKGEEFLAIVNDISISPLPQRSFAFHQVRRGESLSTIARKYRTSVNAIAHANNIYRHNVIVAGNILKIPYRGSATTTQAATTIPRAYDRSAETHIVKRGDSLWIIARRYSTTTKALQELNNLPTTDLYIGQTLKLPTYFKPEKAQDDTSLAVYKVKQGDSPFSIAREHKMNLNRLLNLNQLTAKSTIYPGQELYIE